jgi:hypothetical protein
MKLKRALLVCTVLVCLAEIAEAQQYNQLIAFGDSTTDAGWFANPTACFLSTCTDPTDVAIKLAVQNGGNAHFTGPGPGNAQILAGFFGLTANAANTSGGTNYAIGGAFGNGGPGVRSAWTNIELLSLGFPPNPALRRRTR